MKIILPFILIITVNFSLIGQNERIEAYIERYKEIAIYEMHRTGIPASIKLAQAILESQAGKSLLSVESNNHFGIKCGAAWTGPTFFRQDDDYDHHGNLINSCFRVFENPEESFIAHSTFLLDPAKEHRYGFLFNLQPQDYKSWACGLKKSGYATNPLYANLLITIIEDYALYKLDYYRDRNENIATEEGSRSYDQSERIRMRKLDDLSENNMIHVASSENITTNNKVKLIFATGGDNPEAISEKYGIPVKKILKFNEGLVDVDQTLDRGEYVYLQKKKTRIMKGKKTHVVQPGETMYSIAQRYGIQLEKLTVRNRLFPGEEPASGETIVLKGLIKIKDRPKIIRSQLRGNEVALNTGDLKSHMEQQQTWQELMQINAQDEQKHENDMVSEAPRLHIVESGDTLYSIARKYHITTQMLKEWNGLKDTTIKPGQQIIVNQ